MECSSHSSRTVAEEILYSLLYVNEVSVNKNREENKHKIFLSWLYRIEKQKEGKEYAKSVLESY